MDYCKGKGDNDGEGHSKEDFFIIEDSNSSDGEQEIKISRQKPHSSCKQVARISRESSPPLILFNITSGRTLKPSNLSPASRLYLQEEEEEEEEDSDKPVEEWMILGGEEQVGDSSIHLNLSYYNSPQDDSGDEDQTVKSVNDTWAVSQKDKCGADQSVTSRYFGAGRSLTCNICNRTGHLAKSCYYHRKCPTCILCGIQGHTQRDCPGSPCSSCGLPSHGLRRCERPPLWNQHCQRCGMSGHLSDIRLELPVRPWTVHTFKHKKCPAFCYNCSKKGHYGYECAKRRMISGTFPSLPYVCHYDTMKDVLQLHTRKQKRAKGLLSAGPLPLLDQRHLSEATGESSEENQLVQGRRRVRQDACSRASGSKKWPERRRERREVKRLRREAQIRREGGLLVRPGRNFDQEVCPANPFGAALHSHKLSKPSPQKKRKDEEGGRSKKSREAERWKKRGGIKRGDLYPHGDADIGTENLLSPKQRVRHRRR
ncbi:zinc finger CCHC domain-containing protein 7-like isoform X2 [Eleginops maclovinus]|uniref:zinc finger CCHC domain-containing protein 7-like isoform X2 n=1 Tax=Eleginops maclovinus TaxID=56733 RepID=UPI003080AEE9